MASPPTRPKDHAAEPPEPDDPAYGAYSSPPCFMHELGPDFLGPMPGRPEPLPQDGPGERRVVRRWRRSVVAGQGGRRLRISARRAASKAR